SKKAQPPLPATWDDIKVGHLVIAPEKDPDDGWWQAIVTRIDGDMLSLRWEGTSRGRQFARHRFNVGLMYSGRDLPLGKERVSAQSGSAYPKGWGDIDLNKIVLAKEDGPAEQWWEAKPIDKNGDTFTLLWCDREDVASIMR